MKIDRIEAVAMRGSCMRRSKVWMGVVLSSLFCTESVKNRVTTKREREREINTTGAREDDPKVYNYTGY